MKECNACAHVYSVIKWINRLQSDLPQLHFFFSLLSLAPFLWSLSPCFTVFHSSCLICSLVIISLSTDWNGAPPTDFRHSQKEEEKETTYYTHMRKRILFVSESETVFMLLSPSDSWADLCCLASACNQPQDVMMFPTKCHLISSNIYSTVNHHRGISGIN